MKYFLKKLLGQEIFRSMVSWATIFFFFGKSVNPLALLPTCLMYASYLKKSGLTSRGGLGSNASKITCLIASN